MFLHAEVNSCNGSKFNFKLDLEITAKFEGNVYSIKNTETAYILTPCFIHMFVKQV